MTCSTPLDNTERTHKLEDLWDFPAYMKAVPDYLAILEATNQYREADAKRDPWIRGLPTTQGRFIVQGLSSDGIDTLPPLLVEVMEYPNSSIMSMVDSRYDENFPPISTDYQDVIHFGPLDPDFMPERI
ncbi:hypothetical protein CAQ69_09830 [Stutzerimonas stutzeri]|nr:MULTISPECIES: hypothetical protein [unclassified Pseudomonas]OWG38436.1 hypothetical protein CAQ69_09830 [Stutzerimonas stutzeri]HBP4949416.1 hypothetical protein [Pseudomonas aeruginosa]